MDKALLDGKAVDASWAADLPQEVLAQIRQRFKCISCNANAYLNKGWARQAPHFAAKEHADNCQVAYHATSGSDPVLVQADIVVIPIGGDESGPGDGNVHYRSVQPSRRTSISGAGAITDTSTRRGVSKILQELISNPEFATSQKTIVVAKERYAASEFFVPFLQLGEQHADRIVGVWGTLFDAREGNAFVWLNRGDRKPDIRVPVSIFDELKTIYKLTSVAQLQGAMFLLIGKFNAMFECHVADAKQIAFQINVTQKSLNMQIPS
jgi:hypothetical protein